MPTIERNEIFATVCRHLAEILEIFTTKHWPLRKAV
jgi:hypothetical protein